MPSPPRPPTLHPAPVTPALALKSILIAWFATRDRALWRFCCGTQLEIETERLERVGIDHIESEVAEMNRLRDSALVIAKEIATLNRPAHLVISETIDELLTEYKPRFLLRTDDIPSAF